MIDFSQYGFQSHLHDGKVKITVPTGIHYIREPICIQSEQNIEIEGEDGAVLRATKSLKDYRWQKLPNGIFYTDIDCDADALYVQDKKYIMARFPKYDPNIPIFNGFSASVMSVEKAKEWTDPRGAYIHAMHEHHWGGFSFKVLGKNQDGELTYIGGWQNNRPMGMKDGLPVGIHGEYCYIENLFEELTEPGEWYFDEEKKRVYVLPYENDDLSTAEVAVNSSFFKIEKSSNITLKNLHFEHSSRTFMQTKEPLLRSDWTIYRGGAVYFNECEHCTVTECLFEDIGSNAVFVDGKNCNIDVSKSLFREIGATAVCFVGRSECVRSPLFMAEESQSFHDIDLTPGPKSDDYPISCRVDNCLMTRVGTVEKQATGVEISISKNISVCNTSIYDTSRAAINISEGTFGGHLIDGCDFFDTVKETGDHGSFNSWGRDRFWHLSDLDEKDIYRYAYLDCQEKTVIRNSRFRCDRGWDIDLDDGSGNYEIHHNLCLNGGIKLREGFGRFVHHNICVNNSIHMHVWYQNSGDIVENNIVFEPYHAVLMKEFGRQIDHNILHNPSLKDVRQAKSLSDITGMDAHSLEGDCMFKDILHCDYTVMNNDISGFEDFPHEFGVKYAPLKELAKEPVFPAAKDHNQQDATNHYVNLLDMTVKNIETDDEMSVYGTAGHDGVIVLDTKPLGLAYSKGLLSNDVIIEVDGVKINCVEDIEKMNMEPCAFRQAKIVLIRMPQRKIELS